MIDMVVADGRGMPCGLQPLARRQQAQLHVVLSDCQHTDLEAVVSQCDPSEMCFSRFGVGCVRLNR